MSFDLLAAFASDGVVAFGDAGERRLAHLASDATKIAERLPDASVQMTEDGELRSEVLVACVDRYVFAACIIAAWMRGHAVALPPNVQPQSMDDALARSNVRGLLHDIDADRGIDVRPLLGAKDDAIASSPIAHLLAAIPGDRHVTTLFTSGSTGEPRACPKSASQLLGEAEAHAKDMCRDLTRVVPTVPAIHIYGLLFGVLVPLFRGAAFCRETPLHAPTVAATLARFDADTLVSVPAHLRALVSLEPSELSPKLHVLSSGAALPRETSDALCTRFHLRVSEILGSSETGGIATRHRSTDPWRAFDGVHVTARGDGAMLLRSPFASRDASVEIACADRIEALEGDAATFRHLGRGDNVIKIASKRVDLDEMERRLLAVPGVREAIVFAESDDSARGAQIRIAVVAPTLSSRDLREALLARFDPVVVPRRILVVDALPRESTGKIRRDRVRALFDAASPSPSSSSQSSSANANEEALVRHFEPRPREGALGVFDVHVPGNLEYFRGHFDGDPILPGVVQIEVLVLRQIAATWPELSRLARVTRLRFRRPIRPDDDITLSLTRPDDARVRFELRHTAGPCTEGTLHFNRVVP